MNNNLISAAIKLETGQTFRVINNKILIETIKDGDTYEASIILIKPETVKKYSRSGYIRQIGVEVEGFDAGDKVHYMAYEGCDIEMNKIDYKILIPGNILCKEVEGRLIANGRRTIVKPLDNEEKTTESGIIISASVQEQHADTGVVIASDKYEDGQIVFFPPFSYSQINTGDNKKYFVMYSEDVMGVVE